MQQRRPRLGDILDDYCPRERRITNHAVVAMIDDDVKQTRCTTCDAEHVYKQAKAPAPRRKQAGALSQEVLEDARPRALVHASPPVDPEPGDPASDASDVDEPVLDAPIDAGFVGESDTLSAAAAEDDESREQDDDEGPVHRRLIRATLPRPEGHVPERKEPDFTMRQPAREKNGNRGPRARQRASRHAQGPGQNRVDGARHGSGATWHRSGAGQRPGQGGQRHGNRQGQATSQRSSGRPGGQNRGPGRKRGR